MKYDQRKMYKLLNLIAIYRWSISLKSRVWSGWCHWIIEKRKKLVERQQMLDYYKNFLLKEALSMWIFSALKQRNQRHLHCCSTYWVSKIN